jgi:hypothetical protein
LQLAHRIVVLAARFVGAVEVVEVQEHDVVNAGEAAALDGHDAVAAAVNDLVHVGDEIVDGLHQAIKMLHLEAFAERPPQRAELAFAHRAVRAEEDGIANTRVARASVQPGE